MSTAGSEQAVPRVIVVGSNLLHATLAAFPSEWNAQDPVADTAALWSAFAAGTVDPSSPYIVFSAASASAEQISGAIIAMLPSAKPLVLVEDFSALLPYQQAVVSAATSAGADPSGVSWAASSHDLIALLRGEIARARDLAATPTQVEEVVYDVPDAPAVKPFIASSARDVDLDLAALEASLNATPVNGSNTPPVAAPIAPPPEPTPFEEPLPSVVREPPRSIPGADYEPLLSAVAPTPAPVVAPVPALLPEDPPPAPPPPPPGTPVDMVLGSPAAAHLPTLSVAPSPGVGATVDKTVAVPPKAPGQTTIAVTSSKGGSGKSTTALMLATTLAQSSRAAGNPLRVALVDLDSRDGQVSTLIGTYLPTAFNLWSAPTWDAATISRAMVHSDDLGIDCLLAPARPRASGGVSTDFYRHVIRMLQSMYDVIVIDTAANYLDGATWEVALREANSILLVTTLANTAIQGMSRAVRDMTDPIDVGGLGIAREQLSIVVNQSVAGVGIDMEFIMQAALHVPIVAAVPMATRDVLLATNHSAMQALLKHPYLGPAYFGLARAVLPQLILVPLVSAAAAPPPAPAAPAIVPPPLVSDTTTRETRTTPRDELQSEQTPRNGSAVDTATVDTVTSLLGS